MIIWEKKRVTRTGKKNEKESEEWFSRIGSVVIEVFTSTNSDAAAAEQSDSDGRLSKSLHADSAEALWVETPCFIVYRLKGWAFTEARHSPPRTCFDLSGVRTITLSASPWKQAQNNTGVIKASRVQSSSGRLGKSSLKLLTCDKSSRLMVISVGLWEEVKGGLWWWWKAFRRQKEVRKCQGQSKKSYNDILKCALEKLKSVNNLTLWRTWKGLLKKYLLFIQIQVILNVINLPVW